MSGPPPGSEPYPEDGPPRDAGTPADSSDSAPPPPPPPPSAGPAGPPPPAGAASSDARSWAVAAHLSAFVAFVGVPWVVGPLVVWLIKHHDDAFIEDQAKEALNFNISVLIYGVALAVGSVVIGVLTFGIALVILVPALVALVIAWFVLVVLASVAASRGEAYRYPLTLRLVS